MTVQYWNCLISHLNLCVTFTLDNTKIPDKKKH